MIKLWGLGFEIRILGFEVHFFGFGVPFLEFGFKLWGLDFGGLRFLLTGLAAPPAPDHITAYRLHHITYIMKITYIAMLVVNPLRFQRQVGWIDAQLVVALV